MHNNTFVVNKLGEIRTMGCGTQAKIIDCIDKNEITIEFIGTDEKVICSYQNFLSGTVRSSYEKKYYGVGYIGVGDYDPLKNELLARHYNTWTNVLQRVYSKNFHSKSPTYKGCTISEEWLNFQNFAEWYDKNYYLIYGCEERMELDKDILIKGNKHYSSETAIFVPQFINTLFVNCSKNRGSCPIGVVYNKKDKRYFAKLSIDAKPIHLGSFKTSIEAFDCYKEAKEGNIKKIAKKYKRDIPKRLYDAMMKYKVEITD